MIENIMNYKFKKVLVWVGYYNLKNFFTKKKKDHEFSDLEKEIISIWKENTANRKNELYYKRVDGLSTYYVHNFENDTFLQMISDFEDSKIEISSIKNDIVLKQTIMLGRVLTDRFIKSFEHEVDKRCAEVTNRINEKLMNNIKDLHSIVELESDK